MKNHPIHFSCSSASGNRYVLHEKPPNPFELSIGIRKQVCITWKTTQSIWVVHRHQETGMYYMKNHPIHLSCSSASGNRYVLHEKPPNPFELLIGIRKQGCVIWLYEKPRNPFELFLGIRKQVCITWLWTTTQSIWVVPRYHETSMYYKTMENHPIHLSCSSVSGNRYVLHDCMKNHPIHLSCSSVSGNRHVLQDYGEPYLIHLSYLFNNPFLKVLNIL